MVQKITTSEFKRIFDNELNCKNNNDCVLDFTASWCGPCKMISPILDELSEEYKKIDFYKIDVDEEYELSSLFNIRSVPTLLFIPVGGKPTLHNGAFPKGELKKFIVKYFGNE